MACTGTVYTYAQLEGLWIKAGGPSSVAPLAAAIAEAESGGCSSALNPTDNNGTQTSVGLWQVSNGTHQYPNSWLTAAGNASEAVAKYKAAGNSFGPWGTYNSGAYTAFIGNSAQPDLNVPGSAITGGAAAAAATSTSGCAFSIGGQHLGLVFGHGPSLPSQCLVRKSELRAVLGGMLLAGSAMAGLVGLLILAAAGFRMSGAGRAAGGALEGTGAVLAFVPGAEGAGLALGSAGAAARRAGEPGAGGRSLERRRARRAEQQRKAEETVRQIDRNEARDRREAERKAARTCRQQQAAWRAYRRGGSKGTAPAFPEPASCP